MSIKEWDSKKDEYNDEYFYMKDFYEDPDREVEKYLKRREH